MTPAPSFSALALLPLRALLWGLHWLPAPLLCLLGDAIGILFFALARSRRRIALTNLRLCFPQTPVWQRWVWALSNSRMMARSLLHFGWCAYASRARLLRLVRIEGLGHLRAQEGRAVILLSGHVIGFEFCGLTLSALVPMLSIYREQSNAAITQWLTEVRGRFGGALIPRSAGMLAILRALKSGRRLYYLADQDFGAESAVFAPFFGVPTATVTALSRMARSTKAAVLPCFARPRGWGGWAGYTLTISEPLQHFPSGDEWADATRMNQELEQRVRENPPQYFWMHRRFKTRPPGAAAVYPPRYR